MISNIDISVIIPFYNEEESLPVLYEKIIDVLLIIFSVDHLKIARVH